MNPCPNCSSRNVWDDNAHWGCSDCGWCSLAGLNDTRTPSAPYCMAENRDHTEVARRAADWAEKDRKEEERRRRNDAIYYRNDNNDD